MTSDKTTRPARGPGSRRYERYEAAGLDVTTQPEPVEKKDEPKNQTEAEAQRQFDKEYNNLNMGIPTHRGSDQATYDAKVGGLHGHDRTEEELAEEKKKRHYEGTSTGTPIESTGVSEEEQARLKRAAQDESEVE